MMCSGSILNNILRRKEKYLIKLADDFVAKMIHGTYSFEPKEIKERKTYHLN